MWVTSPPVRVTPSSVAVLPHNPSTDKCGGDINAANSCLAQFLLVQVHAMFFQIQQKSNDLERMKRSKRCPKMSLAYNRRWKILKTQMASSTANTFTRDVLSATRFRLLESTMAAIYMYTSLFRHQGGWRCFPHGGATPASPTLGHGFVKVF